ncbi:Arm DNA-binding domain-containing protein [Lederbergia graminis]|uniref:Arm DNA-binding domain-containing protein n=1 Tax=Lederbergia graminis TaxID=735518 RepID=A0ABW0LDU1_9BACI
MGFHIGIDPITGKRKQKLKSGFNTKQEAEESATTLIHELKEGTYLEETYKIFNDFAIEWLPIYSESKDVKRGTIRVRLHEIGRLLPYFARLKLKDITRKMYQDALNDTRANHRSSWSYRRSNHEKYIPPCNARNEKRSLSKVQ